MKTYELTGDLFTYEISFNFNGLVISDDNFDISNVILSFIKFDIFHPDGSFIECTYFDDVNELPAKYINEVIQFQDQAFDEYVDDVNNRVTLEEYNAD